MGIVIAGAHPVPVLNRKQLDRWPEGSLYVGRGTVLGNPYVLGVDGTRDQVIDRYEAYLGRLIDQVDPVILTALVGATRATALVCSCAPARCHADVINAAIARLTQTGLPIFSSSRAYAGIGSRQTASGMLRRMAEIARRLAVRGYTLRSGGADGADSAFENGAGEKKEIFLPWPGFSGRESGFSAPSQEARLVASSLHPAWNSLRQGHQSLHARNSHQILGSELRSPVDFVVCYTPDGAETEDQRTRNTGGTGQAIALADRWGIPVFNLRNANAMERLKTLLDSTKDGHTPAVASGPLWVR